jgi:methylmalonyl-CoA mutase N-terminal domain/subunit
MAKAIARAFPKLRIEEAAARTQARIDSGQQTIVGVNKFKPDEAEDRHSEGRQPSVRKQQLAKLARLRAERDQSAGDEKLDALTNGARQAKATCWRAPSMPRAPRPRSAKYPTALERSGPAPSPRSKRHFKASTGGGRQ